MYLESGSQTVGLGVAVAKNQRESVPFVIVLIVLGYSIHICTAVSMALLAVALRKGVFLSSLESCKGRM